MKVRVIQTGAIVDISEAKAKYWVKMNYAEIIEEQEEKTVKAEVEKKAVNKKKPTKKAAK